MHTRAEGEIVRQVTPLPRALALTIIGGLAVMLSGWVGNRLWGEKLDVVRFKADSIARDAVDREILDQSGWIGNRLWGEKLDVVRFKADSIARDAVDREILDQSSLTAARVKAMYCATIPVAQQAGCN